MGDAWPFGPDPVTLAAGDENKTVSDEAFEAAQARGFQENGELAVLAYLRSTGFHDEQVALAKKSQKGFLGSHGTLKPDGITR